MKRLIQCAEYVNYNANSRGTNTNDCVKRALSLALNQSYQTVSKELNAICKQLHRSTEDYRIPSVHNLLLKDYGCKPFTDISSKKLTLSEFIDTLGQHGTFLVRTGKNLSTSNHIVCCIDGKIYDSWDSSSQYAIQFTEVPKSISHEFTDILMYMDELSELADNCISTYAYKYLDNFHLESEYFEQSKSNIDGYTIQINCSYIYSESGEIIYSKKFIISFVLTPTMSLADAKNYINKTAKVKMYDRIYDIHQKLNEALEGHELFKSSNYSVSNIRFIGRGRSCFNALPGWAKPFVLSFDVYGDPQYADNYQLYLIPLPGDPNISKGSVRFYGFTSEDIKNELARYKDNYDRIDYDYTLDDIS